MSTFRADTSYYQRAYPNLCDDCRAEVVPADCPHGERDAFADGYAAALEPKEDVGWTQAAKDRVSELVPELLREFATRPILMERRNPNGPTSCNKYAAYFEDVEAWLLARGVRARIETIRGGQLEFESLALVT